MGTKHSEVRGKDGRMVFYADRSGGHDVSNKVPVVKAVSDSKKEHAKKKRQPKNTVANEG